ncbi:MAG TPA: hypothetical protein VE196_00150 [Pseudonocardiaceae bacterium]|jgi:hypothetical protein|nr:hypothetical protein [Pseudonocardiaceae bacterium]
MSVPLAITETTRAAALTAGAISEDASLTIGIQAAKADEFPAAAEEINHGVGL